MLTRRMLVHSYALLDHSLFTTDLARMKRSGMASTLSRSLATVSISRVPIIRLGLNAGASRLTRSFSPACSPFVRHNSSKVSLPESATQIHTVPESLLAQPPPFTSEAATQAIHSIGTLQELGLAKWYTPPGLLQQLLEFVHISTGFAWVASIAVATVMIRVTFFPLMLKSIRNTSKLANINPMVKEQMAKLTQANKEGDKMAAAEAQMSVQKLFKDNGVNPLMSIVPIFIQMPVFIFFYYALNSMIALPVPGMETGGLLWFTDLTAADPKHILPLATSAMTLINFEIGAEVGASQGSQMNPAVKTVFRGVMLLMPYFTWNFPTAIFGYWFTSSLFSLIQGFMFRNPSIRARLRLPPMPSKVVPPTTASGTMLATATPAANSAKPELTGGFWKNFNDTVQGMKDMKTSISDKAQAAAAKQREQEAAKPKIPSKFEDLPPKLQQRKIRQQERFASSRKRKQQFSTLATRSFSSASIMSLPAGKDSGDLGRPTENDARAELINTKDVLLEDMTSLTLDELHEHRELRKYYRKIVYELPNLSEFTKEFKPLNTDQILQFRYTTYFGEEHPSASKVVLEVDIRKLGLVENQLTKLMKLAGPRVNHDTFLLKMSSERFTDPAQNKKYLSDLLDKLVHEARTGLDDFADIPLDRRHMKRSRKARFPKAWNLQRKDPELSQA